MIGIRKSHAHRFWLRLLPRLLVLEFLAREIEGEGPPNLSSLRFVFLKQVFVRPLEPFMLVISCHADTCFQEHQLQRNTDGTVTGHLDNFVGVHAVMRAYFSGKMPTRGIRIELTYGEETDFGGAYEVLHSLRGWDVVIVVDVTGTPTNKDFVIEKCADSRMRDFVQRALEGLSYDLYVDCPDPIADVDETDVYRDACPMTCFLGVPVTGGDYNAEVVSCRERSIEMTVEALCRLAHAWVEEFADDD